MLYIKLFLSLRKQLCVVQVMYMFICIESREVSDHKWSHVGAKCELTD